MAYITEEEAKLLVCPSAVGGKYRCLGRECMAWRHEPNGMVVRRVNYEAGNISEFDRAALFSCISKTSGSQGPIYFDGAIWDRFEKEEGSFVFLLYKKPSTAELPSRGFCGLGGTP